MADNMADNSVAHRNIDGRKERESRKKDEAWSWIWIEKKDEEQNVDAEYKASKYHNWSLFKKKQA